MKRLTTRRQCLREAMPLRSNRIERRLGVTRSPLVAIADAKPKSRWCYNRCRLVPEILAIDGYVPRDESGSVVLIDGGRETIRNVVGSVRQVKVRGEQLIGTIHWARDRRSQDVKAKWLDGHLGIFEAEITAQSIVEYGHGDAFGSMRGPLDHIVRWTVAAVRIRAAHGDD